MLFEERRSLVSFLASKLSDYSENEIIELVEIIEESLRLLEAHDYDWDRLERSLSPNMALTKAVSPSALCVIISCCTASSEESSD